MSVAAVPTERPEPAQATIPPGRRAVRLTAVFALMGVLLAFVGIALAARPLHTETQDCGSAGSFLLDGRVNEFVDPANPPTGVTSAEAKANNVQPCQQRAANRGWPAGILVVGGTFAALTALIAEVIVRATFGRRRTRRRNL